jgi:hypothetical protein
VLYAHFRGIFLTIFVVWKTEFLGFYVGIGSQGSIENMRVIRLKIMSHLKSVECAWCNLKANVKETDKSEGFVDDVLALFVIEVIGNPEVLKELKELHRKKKQNPLSSTSALQGRHLVADVIGDKESKGTEAYMGVLLLLCEAIWGCWGCEPPDQYSLKHMVQRRKHVARYDSGKKRRLEQLAPQSIC